MVQQMIDSKVSEYGLHNPENSPPACEKQPPVALKKTPLRDSQNENRMVVPNSNGNSPYTKDGGAAIDTTKVSGTKRPPAWLNPSQDQSPSGNSPNAHLVYVRRKSEPEFGKTSTCDGVNLNTSGPCLRQVDNLEGTNQSKPQIKEPKVSCFPAFSPLPKASSMTPSAKASVPSSVGKSGMMLPPSEPNNHPVSSATPLLDSPKEIKKLHWEERYCQLQMLLKKLDQSNQEDYVQMLRSLSSVELSRHAVELEKRSIQLTLEEAKEMDRVALLNVLGKTMKNVKAPSSHQDQP
ncbi:hypothetical protein SLEP1_g33564 [Rubroshorea leprosula]|uniref:Uncharacterized protein n=1 Tax=Rubroshorea leprosula TaxID=152421 RepID=A0AAV5KH05_9ROSI|nr:hypothetical protein SLEP1_g33564 [Rubroshorea leprosula]